MQAPPDDQHSDQSIHAMPPAAQHHSKVVSQPIKGLTVSQTTRRLHQHLKQQLRHELGGQYCLASAPFLPDDPAMFMTYAFLRARRVSRVIWQVTNIASLCNVTEDFFKLYKAAGRLS